MNAVVSAPDAAPMLGVASATGVDARLVLAGPGARSLAFLLDWLIRTALAVTYALLASWLILGNFRFDIGPDDEALGRLAAWWKTQTNHDKARETYRRYADALMGQGEVAGSFREQQKYDEAIQTYAQVAAQDN